ncbi:MAG: hypothetical protein Q8P67_04500, partial [archaeon]|nr:hypothetical protein [archaeon]
MSADACPMYPSNQLRSAAYGSTLSLVTLGFWDLVCSSVASVYFALVGLLQILTPFSPTGKYATLLPYLGNKLIEMLFVYRANAKRMLSDHLINSRPVRVLRDDGIVRIPRSQIVVGDLLLLEAEWRDEEVPVDLILLSSATDVFLCLASLTGEKDPVRKVPVPGLSLARTLSEEHKNVYGVCSSPSHCEHLDLFHAELRLGAERYRITSDSFLPAGSTLLHGSEVFGLVFATGPDCKVAVSDAQVGTARRFNLLDTKLNVLTQVTLVLLVLFIFIGSAGKLMSTEQVSFSDTVPVVILYFLLFNGLIAQTLQFSLTLVRGHQGESVPEDDKNNISTFEQMCLCDAVVFDKTGTLTANILQPKYIGLPLDPNSTSSNRSIASQTHNSSGIPTLSRQVRDVGTPDSLSSSSPSLSPTPT